MQAAIAAVHAEAPSADDTDWRQILALYFEEELTLAEIGLVLGITESRVSQLRTLAISRLRAILQTVPVPRTQ